MPKDPEKTYHAQKYRKEWEKEKWASGWLSVSKKGPHKAYCSICDKDLVVGKSELISHTKIGLHKRLSKSIESNHSLTAFMEINNFHKVKAELNTVALIARRNVSFNLLDHLMETLHSIANNSKTIKQMSCNRSKGTYLLTDCLSSYAHEKLVEEMKNSRGFSILCDKATDITMDKTFCVNVRCVITDKCEPTTRYYRLLPVGKNRGADALFEHLSKTFAEDGIEWKNVISCASDGENLVQGGKNSLPTRIKAAVPDLYILKCFCHSFHLVAGHACETLQILPRNLPTTFIIISRIRQTERRVMKNFNIFLTVSHTKS